MSRPLDTQGQNEKHPVGHIKNWLLFHPVVLKLRQSLRETFRSTSAGQLQNKSTTRNTRHVRFTSSSRVDSESNRFLTESDSWKVDRHHLHTDRLLWSTPECERCVLTCTKNHTEAENTPELNAALVNTPQDYNLCVFFCCHAKLFHNPIRLRVASVK